MSREIDSVVLLYKSYRYYASGRLSVATRTASFWWRDIRNLLGTFKEFASVIVGDGFSCFLWSDQWISPMLHNSFLELLSYADLFYLPLFVEAFEQFQSLQMQLDT